MERDKENMQLKKDKMVSGLFYAALIIEILIVIIDKSAYINPIEGRLFQITFLLCGIKVLFTKYSCKEWIFMVFMGVTGLLSDYFTDRNDMMRVVMFIAASKGVSLDKSLKLVFFTTLAGVLFLMGLSFTSSFGTLWIEQDYGRGIIEKRYCFGLGHPNALHCMVWVLVLLGIYLYHNRMKQWQFLLLFIGNIVLFFFTKSKTGIIITMFTILVGNMLEWKKELSGNKWFYRMGMGIFILAMLFAFGTSQWGYSTGPFGWMDAYLTGRIRYSHIVGGTFAWSLFSNPENNAFFDMGFMRLFYWYGIIPGTLYLITNLFQMNYYQKKKEGFSYLIVIAFTIYTVVEAHAISAYIARNYVLLLLIGTWSDIFRLTGNTEKYVWQLWNKGKNIA